MALDLLIVALFLVLTLMLAFTEIILLLPLAVLAAVMFLLGHALRKRRH